MPGRKHLITALLLFGLTAAAAAESGVLLREEPLTLPAYRVGKADPNPIFFDGKVYQGAKGVVYPYPMQDELTDIREDKTYQAVYLENEFLEICVLPEIGGRLFTALDKTNGYDFFYRQHVIKPAFISVNGAWVSGGVEWNVPHHHRASTFMPVDYTVEESADGSKTVWVGEIELRHRLKWLVGLTVHPGKSYLETTVKIFNRTPLVHTFLYWANVAVHADSSYQIIFPPSLEYATYHGKDQFTPWPVSHHFYNGVDYTAGVDLSWWKNHPSPTSLFAIECTEDFFAGYDHGKEAGVVHVADHHLVSGKKLWEWGPGAVGRMWDLMLTETDGPYIELMVGAYSDNQPDYSFIQPYEVKTFKQYWYPIRQLGGVKNANLEAAVNLEIAGENEARVGVNTSAARKNARVVLEAGQQVVFEQTADIEPGRSFYRETALPAGAGEQNLKLTVYSAGGEELISYSPTPKKGSPMPEPVTPPPPPAQIKTIEELYLAGMRLEQFHNAVLEPYPYYEEALRRDPGDYRVNTALGILYCKRGMFGEAEERLRLALARATGKHTKPRDGEASYYLGVACKAQGRYDEAADAFYQATWSNAWYSAGFYSLAELACLEGDFSMALEYLERAISTNALNTKALNLRAAALRRLGRFEAAAKLASEVIAMDPLDFRAPLELYLAQSGAGRPAEARAGLDAFRKTTGGSVQNYLETAADYADCGLWDEAAGVLSTAVDTKDTALCSNPLVYYCLGFYSGKKGDTGQESSYYSLAGRMPPDYVFPFRLESVEVLRAAAASNPADARARYYLGNLLYDRQPEAAIAEWEKSRELDDTFPVVHRNLGLAYARVRKDLPAAVSCLEKAVSLNKIDPRYYYELDRLYEDQGVPPGKRLAFLEKNQRTVDKRDYILAREIELYVKTAQYDKAVGLLQKHHFHVWEGGGKIHDTYVDAHLLRGQKYFRQGKYLKALADFEAALEYPANLEVGKPYRGGREPQVYYFIAAAHESAGDSSTARSFYKKAVAEKIPSPELGYYQGLSFRKLGHEQSANSLFDSLLELGRRQLAASAAGDYFAKFGEKRSSEALMADAHYLMGLGYLGKGDRAAAGGEFRKALELDAYHSGASAQLSQM
ncbi:MAG: DUF5107 domain-containing protein [Candidatus Glassbacteria bacterium]|nr:DUF5107 domain-containing protein [Candidatus Glassbacteria bacterium]